MSAVEPVRRRGRVAIVGRPNVGKSTLLNHILGRKISITSRKPQTTRHRVSAVKTEGAVQVLFVDTPGLHRGARKAIDRYMNRAASGAVRDVDVVVMVVDRTAWTDEDELVLEQLDLTGAIPVIVAVNKVDLLEDRTRLLPHLRFLSERANFKAILPVSALDRYNIDALESCIAAELPESGDSFPEDRETDRGRRFAAAEIVREKIMRRLGDELPYAIAVEIEEFGRKRGILRISALIYVEREGQKRIVIGKGGSRLRSIGADARRDMEARFDSRVMLRLWVKLKRGWSDDERTLRGLGYDG